MASRSDVTETPAEVVAGFPEVAMLLREAGNSEPGGHREVANENPERWVPLPDFPRYEVSDRGRIRRTDNRVVKSPTARPNGRLVACVRNPERHTLALDKLVASAHFGPIAPGYFVAHKDGNLANNRVDNLEYRKRRLEVPPRTPPPWAKKTGRNKLTEGQAREIRERVLAGEPGLFLASEFGVTPAAVSQIKHGKKWQRLG